MTSASALLSPTGRELIGRPRRVSGPLLAWATLLLTFGARTYRTLLLALLVAAMLPALSSWSDYVVRSGSMEPSISVGDVVIAKPFDDTEAVPVGRVMVFDNPAGPGSPELLVHRVVDNLGSGSYATRGDGNVANDTTPVPRDHFRARATILVPFVGAPVTWFLTGKIGLLALWALLTTACFVLPPRRRTKSGGGGTGPAAPGAGPAPGRPGRHAGSRDVTSVGQLFRLGGVAALALVVAAGTALVASSPASAAAFTSKSRTSMGWTVSSTLANNLLLTPPGDPVRGTVPVTATLRDAGGLTFAVRIEYAVAGTTTWQTMCTRAAAPYTCSWVTTAAANRDYDLRAVATAGTTTYTSALVRGVLVDNAAPTVTMTNPGSPLSGTVTFGATASDANSGVSRIVLQYAATSTTTYQDLCVLTQQPWTCVVDTSTLVNGSYSLRAVATDAAGNVQTSAVVTNRTVNNVVSTVVVNDPGAILTGTVTLSASASSTAGVASVRIQGAPAGSATWGDVCTDMSSPYTCTYNTANLDDGYYDMRAILLDGSGRTTISSIVKDRRLDNTSPRALDVQTSNGGTTAGRAESGDTVTLTYSEVMKTTSISPGWSGSALAVTVRLRDGNLLGLGAKGDTLDVLRSGVAVNLGAVNLREDYVSTNLTTQFAATMTATTTTVNGVSVTRVTITLGSVSSGGANLRTVSLGSAMTWVPAATATDLAGLGTSTTAATESGSSDRAF